MPTMLSRPQFHEWALSFEKDRAKRCEGRYYWEEDCWPDVAALLEKKVREYVQHNDYPAHGIHVRKIDGKYVLIQEDV